MTCFETLFCHRKKVINLLRNSYRQQFSQTEVIMLPGKHGKLWQFWTSDENSHLAHFWSHLKLSSYKSWQMYNISVSCFEFGNRTWSIELIWRKMDMWVRICLNGKLQVIYKTYQHDNLYLHMMKTENLEPLKIPGVVRRRRAKFGYRCKELRSTSRDTHKLKKNRTRGFYTA